MNREQGILNIELIKGVNILFGVKINKKPPK
jgi:hypothetical protein